MKEKHNPKALNLSALKYADTNVTLGFNCEPKLKLQLAQDAEKAGLTLSSYVKDLVIKSDINKQSSMPTKKENKKISGFVQTCQHSGKDFTKKRKNMIYASAKERRDFHNQKAAELRRLKSPIDRFLDKNFIILSDLVKEGEIKTFEKYELLLKGFNPNVFTHYAKYDGKICPCFYHFILPTKNPNKVTVIYQPIDFQEIQSSVPKSSKLGNIFKKLFKIN